MFKFIDDLPSVFKKLALINQEKQGNRKDVSIKIGTTKSKGGFNVNETEEGPIFWSDVKHENYNTPYVLKKLREIRENKIINEKEKSLKLKKESELYLKNLMDEINNLCL
jgi:hypothetical protein